MEFLSITNAFLSIFVQFIIYFPTGFLILEKRIKPAPFIVKVPIFVSFGMLMITIAVSVTSIVYIGEGTLPAFAIISYGLLVFKLRKTKLSRGTFVTSLKQFSTIPNIATIIVIAFVISHFCLVMAYLGWPPGVDAISHGLLTGILDHNHRLQASLKPIAPSQPWFEPFGFHVMGAQLSFLFGVFPGEAILILATTIIILILLLIYSLVYFLTNSTMFSVAALLSGFYIYPIVSDIRFLEKWLIGYYYNTPYANLFGYLSLLEFITSAMVIFDENRKDLVVGLVVLLSLVGIAITYPPFVFLPIFYVGSVLILRSKALRHRGYSLLHLFFDSKYFQRSQTNIKSHNFYRTSRKSVLVKTGFIIFAIFLIISAVFLLVNFKVAFQINVLTILQRVQANSFFYSGVVLRPDLLINFTGVWTLLASGLSILSIIKRNRMRLSIFYLMLSSIVLISTILGKSVNDYIWFFFPGRLFAFLIVFDWIMLLTYTNDLVVWLANNKSWAKVLNLHTSRLLISFVVIFVFFMPSVLSQISFVQAKLYGWIFATPSFRNDYELLAWISSNVNETDLIMTDYTYSSKSIQSFSLKNVTATPYPTSPLEVERAKDNAIAWDRPTLLRSFLKNYAVKYILLDSELGHRIPPEIGGDDRYVSKIFSPNQYVRIFNHMPFLKIIKQVGSSTLYKVLNDNNEGR
jgi:hypothetical protein